MDFEQGRFRQEVARYSRVLWMWNKNAALGGARVTYNKTLLKPNWFTELPAVGLNLMNFAAHH